MKTGIDIGPPSVRSAQAEAGDPARSADAFLRVGAIVQIEGRRTRYSVDSCVAIEGGGYRLGVVPLEPPHLVLREEVYPIRGVWRTEQLEEITAASAPIVETERQETRGPAVRAGEQLELDLFEGGT